MPRVQQRTAGGFASVSFDCPGCGDVHNVPVSGPSAWGWNGSVDMPTISPSIDVKAGHYGSRWKPGDPCWCGTDYGFSCYRCHSVITAGKIAFQPDCSHAFAGQTVDLPGIS